MNVDRLLENNALPFAGVFLVDDHHGRECAVVVARLTWELSPSGQAQVSREERPIRVAHPYRTGYDSSLHFPSDFVSDKVGTDVIVLASAHPPAGSTPSSMDVAVRVETGAATLKKALRVHGPRVFMRSLTGVAPGPAGPITRPVPIVYEQAEGGTDASVSPPSRDAENPVGVGHARSSASLVGARSYSIEPLGGNKPAGFGAIDRSWQPRARWYGTTDAAYYQQRFPVVPADFDLRFNSYAHPDLFSATPLRGDEPVELLGMTPEGAFRFKLPHYAPRFDAFVDGKEQRLETHLDTFLIDLELPEQRIVELAWRAKVVLPRKSERLEKIRVTNETAVPTATYQDLRSRIEAHGHHHEE